MALAPPQASEDQVAVGSQGTDDSMGVGPDRDVTIGRRLATIAAVAAAMPVLVAGLRGALRGWTPTGDDAVSALRAWDVFSTDPPLLGTWSSASLYTGHEINHPGPLQFDLLAVPVRLLGAGPGTSIGIALVNAVAVLTIGWLVARRAGPAAAALAVGTSALLSWSMGSEMLYDPWSQHAPLIPFSLFLVAVWCVVAGDVVALPVVVVAGSYALQTHLSYAILVPGLAALATGATLLRLWADRRGERQPERSAGPGPSRRSGLRWLAVTALIAVLCWVQPLYEQATSEGEGNLAALWRSSKADANTPSVAIALRAFGGTVAVPPMWLPPSFGDPSFRLNGAGRPTWLCATALLALAGALVVLAVRARRRGSPAVGAAAVTALAALALGWASTMRMPLRLGLVPSYARFMWPLGMLVWLALGVGLLDEIRARWSVRLPRLALPGLTLAVVSGVAALPTVDNGTSTFSWSVEAIHALDDAVLAAVKGQGPVLVEDQSSYAADSIEPAILVLLQRAGIPFYVDNVHMVSQLGEARRYEPGDARVRLVVRGGASAHSGPGERLVASWSPLSEPDRSELADLTSQLRVIVANHGVPLIDGGEVGLQRIGMGRLLDDIADARRHPDDVVDVDTLVALWTGPARTYYGSQVLDLTVFPPELMDRWCDLMLEADRLPVRVFVAPIAVAPVPSAGAQR